MSAPPKLPINVLFAAVGDAAVVLCVPVVWGLLHWVLWRARLSATRDRVLHDRFMWMMLSLSMVLAWGTVFWTEFPLFTPGEQIIATVANPARAAIFQRSVVAFFVVALGLFPYYMISGWWKSVDYPYRAAFSAKKAVIPGVAAYVLLYHGPAMQPGIYIRLLVFTLRYMVLDAATDAVSTLEQAVGQRSDFGWRLWFRIVLRTGVLVPVLGMYFAFDNIELYRPMFGNMYLATTCCWIAYCTQWVPYLNPVWFWVDALYKLIDD
jgi:hypothetical protein